MRSLGVGNHNTAEFWEYSPSISRRWDVDPMAYERVSWTPYNAMRCNPILNIDPTGALDNEYDKEGNKISDLGGDKVDFYHQEDGSTIVKDLQTSTTNKIKGGKS